MKIHTRSRRKGIVTVRVKVIDPRVRPHRTKTFSIADAPPGVEDVFEVVLKGTRAELSKLKEEAEKK